MSDYDRIVRRLHDRGIGVIAGIVFGHDWDTPAVFSRTLQFLVESKIDALQATILTPFPGTPLFREMETQGRMIDRDWAHYDFANVVFEPKQMSREMLRAGHRWVLNKFPLVLDDRAQAAPECTLSFTRHHSPRVCAGF